MNRIIKLFTIIHILSNILYADITKEKIYQYLDVSAGGVIFSSYHFGLLNKFNYTPNKEDNKKYLNSYFDGLDLFYYNDMITFYNTKVGKKYRKVINNMNDEYLIYDMAKNPKEMFNILHIKKNKCTKNRKKLIDDIENNLNFMKIRLSFYIKTMYQINHFLTKDRKKSIDALNVIVDKKKTDFLEYHKIVSCDAYKDFLIEELEELAKYSSSAAAKHEVILTNEGFSRYIKLFIPDLMKLNDGKK